MKRTLSLRGRGLQLLAQREHSRLELRRKLMRYAQVDIKARAEMASKGDPEPAPRARVSPTSTPSADQRESGDFAEKGCRPVDAGAFAEGDKGAGDAGEGEGALTAPSAAPSVGLRLMSVLAASGLAGKVRLAEPGVVPVASGRGQARPARVSPDEQLDDGAATAAELVEAVLDWLQARGYLSEERFVESRLHARASRFGNQRIRQELAQHGVQLTAAETQSLKESELARARAVWSRKFGHQPADAAEKVRQMRFLAGRGFSSEVIRRVLQAGQDE